MASFYSVGCIPYVRHLIRVESALLYAETEPYHQLSHTISPQTQYAL
jgi:hypothetical protein